MQRFIGSVFVLALAVGLVSSRASAQMGGGYGSGSGGSGNKVILTFKTMYGVNGPFVGPTNPLRDIPGDDVPWVVKSVKGSLTNHGKLSINVKGLVIPPGGTNDEPEFRALVSCLAVDGANVVTNNQTTGTFPATTTGNAKIKAQLTLPQPCLAPIVMILAGSEDKWFAATGF